jgi:hypothetical protein
MIRQCGCLVIFKASLNFKAMKQQRLSGIEFLLDSQSERLRREAKIIIPLVDETTLL